MTTPQTRNDLYNEEAEKGIVGAVLIDNSLLPLPVAPSDFHLISCQYAYDAALALHDRGQAIDLLTLENELRQRGKWADTGLEFLRDCEQVPTASNAASYAAIVADFARRRKTLDIASALAKAAFSKNGNFDSELGLSALSLNKMVESVKPPDDGPARFNIHWAAEALEPQPPVDWIVERLFSPGSVSLIVGEGGTRKTYSMIDLAVSVGLGQPWLGFNTKKVLALLIDEESGDRRMRARLGDTLRGHDAGPDTPVGYICLAGLDLRNADDLRELHAVILGTGAQLVIIDALADIMPGGDENSVKDVQPVFHALRVIAEETQCAIIVIHHSNKVGTYRGSTALKGAVDLMLMVTCDGDRVTFTTEKARDIEPVKFAALANFAPGSFNLSPTDAAKITEHYTKSQSYVLRYLQEHGASKVEDITAHADTCAPETARRAIYQLVDRSKVRRVDSGGKVAIFGLAPE